MNGCRYCCGGRYARKSYHNHCQRRDHGHRWHWRRWVCTYNISTASAFVIAGCIPLPNTGINGFITSGAADVLSALGIKLDCDFTLVKQKRGQIAFLMAPRHPQRCAMWHLCARTGCAPSLTCWVRWQTRPWETHYSHVYDRTYCAPFAHVLAELGTTHACRLWCRRHRPNICRRIEKWNRCRIHYFTRRYWLPTATLDVLRGGDGAHNAIYLRARSMARPAPIVISSV